MLTLTPECQQLLISGYVLDNLSPAEALLFAEMVQENPGLVEQISLMQQALDLAYMPNDVPPPPALRDRILAAANAQQLDVPSFQTQIKTETNDEPIAVAPGSKSFSQSFSKTSKIFGAIALAIITALGIANYRLWQNVQTAKITDSQNPQNPQIDQTTYLLQNQALSQNAIAQLIVNPNRLSATLTADNLPPLPQNKVYALWTVVGKDVPYTTDEKGAILTAVFQVNESGSFAQEIAVPQPHLESKTINKMAITVEDISVPQAHQGEIFISTGN